MKYVCITLILAVVVAGMIYDVRVYNDCKARGNTTFYCLVMIKWERGLHPFR